MSNIETLRNDGDFDYIKKEALIHFGFKPIPTGDFIYWYEKERWDFESDEIEELKAYKGDYVDLLTDEEKAIIGEVNEEDDNPNRVVKWLLEDGTAMDVTRSDRRKERYKLANKLDWFKRGQELKQQRESLGLSLTKLAQMIGTSPSRISNFEQGEPVMMSNQLAQSYKLALEHYELKNKETQNAINKVNHVFVHEYGKDFFIIYLAMDNGELVHIQDIEGLQWALFIASNKFKQLEVDVILESDQGEKMIVDKTKEITHFHHKLCHDFLNKNK
ncbi:helix-turn-helix domain-containing protein [Niallia sp. 01092]|uniref:helix-turn-helix domain-containing protein n=1 Tax=Niallia sp. 01092 TaxID=3457759 RepID=UPI003FD33254